MTKKTFKQVAEIVFNVPNVGDVGEKTAYRLQLYLAGHFADLFSQENTRFDRRRFMAACGINEEDV